MTSSPSFFPSVGAGENSLDSETSWNRYFGMSVENSVPPVRRHGGDNAEHRHDPASAPSFATVSSKMAHPLDRPRMVRRERLLRTFTAVADTVPLVLLVAPSGYGKTTALGQWAGEDERSFGWVDLDESDNDPVLLLRHIALALHHIRPLNDAVWRALASPTVSPLGVVVPRLVASATANAAPWVLVLDDFHVLTGTLGMDLVVALANDLPPGCHLVVASRSRPGLKLARMRSQGKLVEFGTEDLSLTEDEASAALAEAGARLPGEAVATLVRRTEGWPAGVYLAGLSVRGAADEAAAAAGIAGADTFIVDYFREKVLVRESAETVRFLLRTAVLDEMSGPLCDAILGQTGSATWLAEIESRNLFVVPQDHQGRWYRYHRLFREMLLSELRRREPGEEQRIHRRAAAWYEEHRQPEQAIAHALAGRDTPVAARLVAANSQRFVNAGRIYTVRSWLEELDDGALADQPGLAVVAGWVWALAGDAARAQRCLLAGEQGPPDAAPPLDGSASLTSGVARLRAGLAPLGVERMLDDARRAVELEPPGGPWSTLAEMLFGVALLLDGEPDAATKAWERAAYFGRQEQASGAGVALAQLSLLAAERGDWAAAQDYATESWTRIETAGLPEHLSSIVSYVARARVAVHQGESAQARHLVGRALRLYLSPSPAALPWLAAQMAIVLGQILLDLDDVPAARLKLAEAGRHLNRLLTEGVLRDQHRRLAADLARRGGRARVPSAMTLTAAELRVLDLLPTHLTLAEIAEELHISRNTVKSQVAAVYRKLRAATRTEAVHKGRNLGLIES
jgi:LuxR family maltose regulon positive regulatory protein